MDKLYRAMLVILPQPSWHYSYAPLDCREVLSAMATQAMQRLPQFNSQNMSNTLWAFASLNHHPGSMLLKVLQRELVHKLPHFTSQGIENVLWAFATLGHHPGLQFCCKL